MTLSETIILEFIRFILKIIDTLSWLVVFNDFPEVSLIISIAILILYFPLRYKVFKYLSFWSYACIFDIVFLQSIDEWVWIIHAVIIWPALAIMFICFAIIDIWRIKKYNLFAENISRFPIWKWMFLVWLLTISAYAYYDGEYYTIVNRCLLEKDNKFYMLNFVRPSTVSGEELERLKNRECYAYKI